MTFSHLADNKKINFKLFNALSRSLKAFTCIESNPPTLSRLMKRSRTCGQKNAIRWKGLIHLIHRISLNNCSIKQSQVDADFFFLFGLERNPRLEVIHWVRKPHLCLAVFRLLKFLLLKLFYVHLL